MEENGKMAVNPPASVMPEIVNPTEIPVQSPSSNSVVMQHPLPNGEPGASEQ